MKCAYCDVPFEPSRVTARFCSKACARAANREYARERVRRRGRTGRCYSCGTADMPEGQTRCDVCREKHAANERRRRRVTLRSEP